MNIIQYVIKVNDRNSKIIGGYCLLPVDDDIHQNLMVNI